MIRLILQSRLARWIGAVLAAVAAVLSFGQIKKREGGQAERAKEAARDAADFTKTVKKVSHETISDDSVVDIRQRLRERGERKP